MIILDTNVISEPLRPEPHPGVLAWLDAQPSDSLSITAITVAEVLKGVAMMPAGRRRDHKREHYNRMLALFDQRILPFDTTAAELFAYMAAEVREIGRGFPLPDAYIAAIAAAWECPVATRDTGPFEAVGVPVINPWEIM